jgi:hypothetical protein
MHPRRSLTVLYTQSATASVYNDDEGMNNVKEVGWKERSS